MSIKVVVATHKEYEMPSDEMYIPVQVGAAEKESIGYQRDDEGENISLLNPYYCELTGLYWAWKNLSDDYIGLVHYRRMFLLNGHIATRNDIEKYLNQKKVFVPRKRRYYIESLKSHYEHTHYPLHLEVTRAVIEKVYPMYLDSYDIAINRNWGYMFNMMIMEKSLLNDYCTWLFTILHEIYAQVDTTEYPVFAKRYIGRLSEILFNVWLEEKIKSGKIKKSDIKELSLKAEDNWLVKVPAFFRAKFWGIKYKGSF